MRVPVLLALLLVLLVLPAAAAGETPPGPRLATVELIEAKGPRFSEDDRPPAMALATVDPSTGKQQRFLQGKLGAGKRLVPSPFHPPAWSLDGSLLAFAAHQGGRRAKDRIFLAASDGSGVRPIPGTSGGSQPVLSPDGFTLAFSRTRFESDVKPGRLYPRFYSSTTTWIVDFAVASRAA